MIDEQALRRSSFIEGSWIRLANRALWSLPDHSPDGDDLELIGILKMIRESEDEAERLRSELALTILLLSRNYELSPEDYRAILDFPPGDPSQAELQRRIHEIALSQIRRVPDHIPPARDPIPLPAGRWPLFRFFRPLRRIESSRTF